MARVFYGTYTFDIPNDALGAMMQRTQAAAQAGGGWVGFRFPSGDDYFWVSTATPIAVADGSTTRLHGSIGRAGTLIGG